MISIEILLLMVIAAAVVSLSLFVLIGLGAYIVKSFFGRASEERPILMLPSGMGPMPRDADRENGGPYL